MSFSTLRIGYAPVSDDWSQPADRRRFGGYARARSLRVEKPDPRETYDLVVLSQRADLTAWAEHQRSPIIYECIDPYLLPPRTLRGRIRGLGKFLTRQHRGLQWQFHRTVQAMCQRADAVVCATDAQRQLVLPYCSNVHVILDIFDAALRTVKQDYRAAKPFALVWEGLAPGAVRDVFPYVRDVVAPLLESGEARLHLITDVTYGRISDQFGRRHTSDDVRRIFGPLARAVSIYQWSDQTFAGLITACDLAIVPIPPGDPFVNGKPENKLVLLWRTGMPVVTSATPAYRRAMERSGVPLLCSSIAEWHDRLRSLMHDETQRRSAAAAGRRLAESEYASTSMIARWDAVVQSVLRTANPVSV